MRYKHPSIRPTSLKLREHFQPTPRLRRTGRTSGGLCAKSYILILMLLIDITDFVSLACPA